MTLEEQIKEIEAQVATLTAALADRDAIIAQLQTANGELTGQVSTLSEEKNQVEKDLTIEKANTLDKENDAEAGLITSEVLSSSSLGEQFHDKVKAMVDHNKHKTEDGKLDKEAFQKAFQAEVTDWESRMKGKGIGLGKDHIKTETDDASEFDEKKKGWGKILGHKHNDNK